MAGLVSLVRAAEMSYSQRVAARNGTSSDGPISLTYGEVADRSDRLAAVLLALQGSNEGLVASLLGNRIEAFEFDIALIKAGLGRVSLNTRLAYDEIAYILANSQARVLVYDGVYADIVEELLKEHSELNCVYVGTRGPGRNYNEALSQSQRLTVSPPISPDSPSLLMYTSGTTGRPKGANWTFRTRLAGAQNMLLNEIDERAAGVMMHVGSLSHGSGSKVVPVYLRGGCNVAMNRFDPDEFFKVGSELHATATFVVPTMIQMLINAVDDRVENPIPSMSHIAYGGAKMPLRTIEAALATFGNVFFQVYGSCEAPHPILKLDRSEHATRDPKALGTAGRPSIGVEVMIGDQSAVPGARGEVLIRSEHLMANYWQDEISTAEVMNEGFYRSGDIGVVHEDGLIEIVDRVKNMIITGGFNVYPAEVERVLQDHPAVAQVCVYGLPDARWGEAVVAAVVLNKAESASELDLQIFCSSKMAGYKKPQIVRFVNEFPLGPTGKILTSELRRMHTFEEISDG